MDDPKRSGGVSLGQLAVGFVAMMGFLGLATRIRGLGGILVFAVALATLGLAAALWGYDSRDGKDWKTSRRPPPRSPHVEGLPEPRPRDPATTGPAARR